MSLATRSLTGKCPGSWGQGRVSYICIAIDNKFTNSTTALAWWTIITHLDGGNMSASVAVYRDIYTEDRFRQAYGSEESASGSLRLREKLAGRCRCSRRACLHLLRERVPIFNWLPRYRLKKWLLGDTIAGLTVGILHIPQGEEATGCHTEERTFIFRETNFTCKWIIVKFAFLVLESVSL